MNKKENKGISLIVLVITIIVVMIIAGSIILSITNGGILDNAKKAKFMSDFKSVEEGVSLYSMNNLIMDPNKIQLPVEGKLSLTEKKYIADNNPTLKTKVEELNEGKLIDNTDLYWISEQQIGVEGLSKDKSEKGYIIDATTGQIYDYVGEFFENKRWHTLDNGVDEAFAKANQQFGEDIWNGWLKLTLYYPKDVTDKKWRLGSTGELRSDPMLMWQNYIGPIMIPINRTEDIWISYKVNGKEVIVPPAGTLLVDIVPDKTGSTKVSKVNVRINYDSEATIKEYRINDSGWLPYTSQFTVTENCIIEARAKKVEKIYNTDGSLKLSRDIVGSDMVYIGNIGNVVVEEASDTELAAPIIERLAPQNGSEKARVKITYPSGAATKAYTQNYGSENSYTSEISVSEWGTTIIAYYYDSNGNKSKASQIYINDTTGGAAPEAPSIVNNELAAPIIQRLVPQNGSEKARVKIIYPSKAVTKVYTVNNGAEQNYTSEISINEWETTVVGYYYDAQGNKSRASQIYINDTTLGEPAEEPKLVNELGVPIIERLAPQSSNEKARVKITYPNEANKKIYTVNYGVEENYLGEISINEWGTTIVAYYYDSHGNKSKVSKIYINDTTEGAAPEVAKPVDVKTPEIVPAPTIERLTAQNVNEKARVKITYPENAVIKVHKVNYGFEEDYTGEISVKEWGTNIIAYYYDADGNMSQIASITINDTSLGQQPEVPEIFEPLPPYNPVIPQLPTQMNTDMNLAAPTMTRLTAQNSDEKARVHVEYPSVAERKIYTINDGAEIEYTGDIKINGWGTKIIAYYYDEEGNRSKQSQILINEDSIPAVETEVFEPESVVEAPTINISPSTGIVSEVTVNVTTPVSADKIYLKLGKYGQYKEYIGAVTVKENMEVYAYYKATTGETSITAEGIISNIKQGNKPYLRIDANPYPWPESKGIKEVIITLNYSDANKIEYSEDGIVYNLYTAPFKLTENKRVYARAINTYGVAESYLDITNIGSGTTGAQPESTGAQPESDAQTNENLIDNQSESLVPEPLKKLAVSINADPDPSISQTKVAKVIINIEYDASTTEKLYSIGKYGDIKIYTGPFEITSNCTIYAYAKAENALGETTKSIDNLLDGISDPVITTEPTSGTTASRVVVSIKYDASATVKKYSINGGPLQDYTQSFDIIENGTKIYAYSENAAVQKSEANYIIQNIIPEPPIILLDKGSYYLVKLNYPIRAQDKQYMWKNDDIWKEYKDDGILLIKPQFKDQVIKNGSLIKIENEIGQLIDFKGDYYLIDVPISELSESISMRWERVIPKTPEIAIDPTTATKNVTATITYEDDLVVKQYRLLEPGGTLSDWIDYAGPIAVDRKNTVIYAKGMDFSDAWSEEAMLKVINIDEESPYITVTADTTTSKQQVPATVNVTDDSGVSKVKWAAGVQGESYFVSSGTDITNNSIVNITENGYYTFYAEDIVGNTQIYTLNVENIDNTSPENPIIQASTTAHTNGDVTVTITYPDDATNKEYSIDGTTWSNYISPILITSNKIIYARAIDIAGNQSGQSTLTIANIDKIIPTVSFGINGGSVQLASTTVTITDLGGSDLNINTLQYIWDTQNIITPSSGWTTFTNGSTLSHQILTNEQYYLWIKASDNAGNNILTKSNDFRLDTNIYDDFSGDELNADIWGTYAIDDGSKVYVENNKVIIQNKSGYAHTGGGFYTKKTFPNKGILTVEYDWQPGTCYVSALRICSILL